MQQKLKSISWNTNQGELRPCRQIKFRHCWYLFLASMLACSTCQQASSSCPALSCSCCYTVISCVWRLCNGSLISPISKSNRICRLQPSAIISNVKRSWFHEDYISRVFNQKRYMHLHPMAHNHYLSSSANSTSLNGYNDTMLWLQTSCCLQQILLKRTTICCRYVHGFQSFSSVAHWHPYAP